MATVIPRVHDAMFAASFEGRENPYNTGLQRQFWYTMWMMVLACCARRSLFTTFCPRIDQVDVDDAVVVSMLPAAGASCCFPASPSISDFRYSEQAVLRIRQ